MPAGRAGFSAEYDVIVVGSGGAGLTAALACAAGGLSVLVAERMDRIGGTTAMSGGGIWIPGNHLARAAGIADDAETALRYIRAVSPAGWEAEEGPLWEAFAREAPRCLSFVEQATPLRFALSDDADPYPEAPGALATGRMVSPRPIRRAGLRLQPPHVAHLLTYQEMRRHDPWHRPGRAAFSLAPRLAGRLLLGRRAQGTALVAGLARGLGAAGGRVATGLRVVELCRGGDGRVVGVSCATARGPLKLRARRGVVLASGGFERDTARRARHFAGPVDLVASAPGNTGDAARMAEAVGARLARMDQANIAPALPARLDGAPLPVGTFHHREPGAILVDRGGRRFVNEYLFNLGEVLAERDPATGASRHLPAWMVTDRATLRTAPLLRRFLARAPGWAREAGSPAGLAAAIDVPPAALAETLLRFNADAAAGEDRDFGRHLDPLAPGGRRPERLRPIAPPLVALPFNLCLLSTKGGPRIDAHARVLDRAGAPIPGLYCAGVAMANPFGTRAVGSGTTLGPNMTWGYIAALRILGDEA
ncbi:FAD-dependent oxidoreductase [Amaricoccus solimangrovi]|uniref:FAD-dependent oxidoreductase n=1 Tax=Amaricoccus solimangrovi TaxID=2589815 RepID=A0A501WFY1_9RHOB|nr:FAD-dependent oxidoreductase [Amaricoccus solimangrovi]TPE47712.1 FAD-dependent oxidoreductase [Amaricoccus solimangrovi]